MNSPPFILLSASQRGGRGVNSLEKLLFLGPYYPILRSIIDTAIKNNQNVLQALNVIGDYKRI